MKRYNLTCCIDISLWIELIALTNNTFSLTQYLRVMNALNKSLWLQLTFNVAYQFGIFYVTNFLWKEHRKRNNVDGVDVFKWVLSVRFHVNIFFNVRTTRMFRQIYNDSVGNNMIFAEYYLHPCYLLKLYGILNTLLFLTTLQRWYIM